MILTFLARRRAVWRLATIAHCPCHFVRDINGETRRNTRRILFVDRVVWWREGGGPLITLEESPSERIPRLRFVFRWNCLWITLTRDLSRSSRERLDFCLWLVRVLRSAPGLVDSEKQHEQLHVILLLVVFQIHFHWYFWTVEVK